MDSESMISLSVVFMAELQRFENRGFGWICSDCAAAQTETPADRPRLMREGEAEAGFARLASGALARWADRERGVLECPKCGAVEQICRNEDP